MNKWTVFGLRVVDAPQSGGRVEKRPIRGSFHLRFRMFSRKWRPSPAATGPLRSSKAVEFWQTQRDSMNLMRS